MNDLFFHHSIDLQYAWPRSMPAVRPSALLDPPPCRANVNRNCSRECYETYFESHEASYMDNAYEWLAERVGFWPIFMKVGNSLRAQWTAGEFGLQFSQARAGTPDHESAPKTANKVLFSFRSMPDTARFFFEDAWVTVMNEANWGPVSATAEASLFKAQLNRADWMRLAARYPACVEAVVPLMPLARAPMVSCRNLQTARTLVRRGFLPEQVYMRRFPADHDLLDDPKWNVRPVSMAERARRAGQAGS